MTASELIAQGNDLLVDVIPESSWLNWMNWALDDLAPHLCLETSGQAVLAAGQQTTTLPTDMVEGSLWRVECSGVRWPRLQFGSTESPGSPGWWCYGGELWVPSAYDTDQTLTLYYERQPARLTTANDTVDLPAGWERMLMLAGAMRGKQQVPDLASKVDFQAELMQRQAALMRRAARLRSRRRPREFTVQHYS